MNILEQTEALKDLPDQALIKEMQMPTGMAPPVFITAELKRRQRMRNEYKRREAQDMPTVAEEVVMAAGMPQGGIADAARAMAPKSSIAQNTGMNEMMPAAATRAPQRMSEGGIMGMRKGGFVTTVYKGMGYLIYNNGDVENILGEPVSDELAQQVRLNMFRRSDVPNVDSEGPTLAEPQPDMDSSRQTDPPIGDDSPSITSVSPVLTDVRGLELGPAAKQFSSMDMVPSFNVGQLKTLADPEVIPASEQLPTKPSGIQKLSEQSISGVSPTVDLDLVPETSDNQQQIILEAMNPAFDKFGGDPLGQAMERKAATAREQSLDMPSFMPDPSNAKRDFDVMVPTIDRDRSRDQQLLSKALEAKSLPITPTEDFRREFADYGDDISPFDPADIADTTVSRGNRRKNTGDPITGEDVKKFLQGYGILPSGEGNLSGRNLKNTKPVEEAPVSLTPTGFSPDPEALPLDDSVVDMAAATGTPTLGGGDPALEQGIASALAPVVTGNIGNEKDVDGGDKKPTTPNIPSVTGTGSSPLRDRISRMLDEREANKESDKWMALAQTGLALMASKNPTIGGALGEAGLVGVGALQKAKSSYDKDILSLLGMQEDMRVADLNYAAKVAKANKPTTAKVGDYSTGAIRFLEAANEVRGTEKVTDDTGQTSEVPKPLSKLTEDERREYDKLMSNYYSFLNSIKTKLPTNVDVTT